MCVYLTYLTHLLHGKDIFIHRKKKRFLRLSYMDKNITPREKV